MSSEACLTGCGSTGDLYLCGEGWICRTCFEALAGVGEDTQEARATVLAFLEGQEDPDLVGT